MPVVALADAVPDPGAVVVEALDAVVALPAVCGTWRPVQLTGLAEPQRHKTVVAQHLLEPARQSIKCWVELDERTPVFLQRRR